MTSLTVRRKIRNKMISLHCSQYILSLTHCAVVSNTHIWKNQFSNVFSSFICCFKKFQFLRSKLVPPIESELSFLTGTFLKNYDLRDRKPISYLQVRLFENEQKEPGILQSRLLLIKVSKFKNLDKNFCDVRSEPGRAQGSSVPQ